MQLLLLSIALIGSLIDKGRCLEGISVGSSCEFNYDTGDWVRCPLVLDYKAHCKPDLTCSPDRPGAPCKCTDDGKCQRCMLTQTGLTNCDHDPTCKPTPPTNGKWQLLGGHCECAQGHCKACPDGILLEGGIVPACHTVPNCNNYKKQHPIAAGGTRDPEADTPWVPTRDPEADTPWAPTRDPEADTPWVPTRDAEADTPFVHARAVGTRHPEADTPFVHSECKYNKEKHEWERCYSSKWGLITCDADPTCKSVPVTPLYPADFHKSWPGGSCACVGGDCIRCTEGLPPQYGRPCEPVLNCDKYRHFGDRDASRAPLTPIYGEPKLPLTPAKFVPGPGALSPDERGDNRLYTCHCTGFYPHTDCFRCWVTGTGLKNCKKDHTCMNRPKPVDKRETGKEDEMI